MRVGADVDGVISPAVRGRSIGRLVDQHRTMIQSDWQRRFADASRRRQHAGREIELLEAALTRCADEAERMELAKARTRGGGGGAGSGGIRGCFSVRKKNVREMGWRAWSGARVGWWWDGSQGALTLPRPGQRALLACDAHRGKI